MSSQLTFDFSRRPQFFKGKKDERITFTASSDLKEFLNLFSHKVDFSISELCHRYVSEGLQKDLGILFLEKANRNKTLEELRKRY